MSDETMRQEANPAIAAAIARHEALIPELEAATAHARSTVAHFQDGELARAGAHGLAIEGHLATARRLLDEAAIDWARHSRP